MLMSIVILFFAIYGIAKNINDSITRVQPSLMSIIVVNQFSCILIIYYLILHRIITLQHRVTKYIIHSINSVVVENIIGERTNNILYV